MLIHAALVKVSGTHINVKEKKGFIEGREGPEKTTRPNTLYTSMKL